jgi:hypothetical protein
MMEYSWRLFTFEGSAKRVESAAKRRPVAAPERVAHLVVE